MPRRGRSIRHHPHLAIADELEVAWQRFLLIIDEGTRQTSPQARGRVRAALIRDIRGEIAEIGAGDIDAGVQRHCETKKILI